MTDGPLLTSPLVSTQWLADHLGADGLLVVDATVLVASLPDGSNGYVVGDEVYLVSGHLPGAVFADLIEAFSDHDGRYPFTRPSLERFTAAASELGVGASTSVVVYDRAQGQWASRLWWLFRAFGYDRVAVLDGGQRKWEAEDRELDFGHVAPIPGAFAGVLRPELWADKARIDGILAGEEQATLVCAVPQKEFTGEEGKRARRGHIPGSTSVPVARVVDVQGDNAFRSRGELRAAFADVLDGGTTVLYCAGGIAATADALALTLIGKTDIAVYDGSLNEWSADPSAPLVTTA